MASVSTISLLETAGLKPRPENSVGYHAGNWLMNLQSIAICLNGNFDYDQPTDYQKTQLGSLLSRLLLMQAAAETLIELAADPKHLGAKIGVLMTLHTWGRNSTSILTSIAS